MLRIFSIFGFLCGLFISLGYADAYRAAIFNEPDFPITGQSTPAQTFREVLNQDGIATTVLDAKGLADTQLFNAELYDLLVVPTGASFPLAAKAALLEFLQRGGDLLCTGGYAFDALWVKKDGKWEDYSTFRAQEEAQARDPQIALLPNGGFEAGTTGWETGDKAHCTITQAEAYSGKACARVSITASGSGARWEKKLTVEPGKSYLIGAQVKTQNVLGGGYGYLAIYQYDRQGKLLQFVDFTQIRQTQDWRRYETKVDISSQAANVMFYGGLYQASGILWFDEVTCAAITKEERINAHYGRPEDGLRIDSTQVTLFSPDQSIQGVSLASDADFMDLPGWRSPGEVKGFEATAQLRQNARWIPIVRVLDAWGRDAGVAGALVDHYKGQFYRSRWAIFGVANRDIFAGTEGSRLLSAVVRRMRSGIFIQPLETDYAFYLPGETVTGRMMIHNTSRQPLAVAAEWSFHSPYSPDSDTIYHAEIQSATLPAKSIQTLNFSWKLPNRLPDLVVVRGVLKAGDRVLDSAESGIGIKDDKVIQNGVKIRYRNNAFALTNPNGCTRSVCLWGTDTYGNLFQSLAYSPLTWFHEMQLMQDYGLHGFENLQMIPRDYRFSVRQWRQLDAYIQLSQRLGLPYMAGLLIGQDVVVSDAELQQQAEFCRQFAARYKSVPGLIYYLNGDFQLRLKDIPDIRRLWNEFLRERYSTDAALQQAWKNSSATLGNLPVQARTAQSWYDVQARDVGEFEAVLMKRWIGALCRAIRTEDADHPITSEYYQRPYSGIDLRLTMDEMDAANFGYFDLPQLDLARLAATIKWNDMRLYGKTVNMGEFGVKTHDAWTIERGGTGYHIRRTEKEQQQLFWTVAHTALAMGVTKIQNWCFSDDADSVFPWGIAWNNPPRPKPVLKLYRNLRLLAEFLQPEYSPAKVVLMMPDQWRLGAPENLSYNSLVNAIECLLATHTAYDVANESQLAPLLSNPPKLLIAPLAYALADSTVDSLIQLAERDCRIYLSGDPGINPLGQRVDNRLENLCGVHFQGSAADPSGLPQIRVTPVNAEPMKNPLGIPMYRNTKGQGVIFYTPNPWENFPGLDLFLAHPEITAATQTNLYLSLLPMAGVESPIRIQPAAGVWRALETRSGRNRLITLFPRTPISSQTAVDLFYSQMSWRFTVGEAIPSAILLDENNQLLAASGSRALSLFDAEIASGDSPWMILSLQDQPVPTAQALLIATTGGGKVKWQSRILDLTAVMVEWKRGNLEMIDSFPLQPISDGWEITTSADELYLIAPASQMEQQKVNLQNLFSGKVTRNCGLEAGAKW